MSREDKIKLLNALHSEQQKNNSSRYGSPSKDVWNSSVALDNPTLPSYIHDYPKKVIKASP